jgi:hypothetical protein
MPNIHTKEDHTYNHYNRALGCKVESKEHYHKLMAQGGFVPLEMAEKIAEESRRDKKPYLPSEELQGFLSSLKNTADSKGNVCLGGRAIAKMKEFGVDFSRYEHFTKNQKEGGFN